MTFKTGDMVILSDKVKSYPWWTKYRHLWGMELMVIGVYRGLSKEKVIHFHDPLYGTRCWRESNFLHTSLENK